MSAYIYQFSTDLNVSEPLFINPFNQPEQQWSLTLFITKFIATTVMHINIYPDFSNSMLIMKYVNNHPSRFDHQNIAFSLGMFQMLSSFIYEILNAIVLYTQSNVYFALIYFITVYVLSKLGTRYYNSISVDTNNILFDMFLEEN